MKTDCKKCGGTGVVELFTSTEACECNCLPKAPFGMHEWMKATGTLFDANCPDLVIRQATAEELKHLAEAQKAIKEFYGRD